MIKNLLILILIVLIVKGEFKLERMPDWFIKVKYYITGTQTNLTYEQVLEFERLNYRVSNFIISIGADKAKEKFIIDSINAKYGTSYIVTGYNKDYYKFIKQNFK